MTPRRRLSALLALSLGLAGTLAAAAVFRTHRSDSFLPVAPSVEAWGAASRAPLRYVVTDLGSLPGSSAILPRDINNAGQVVGDAERVQPPLAARFRNLVRLFGIDLDPRARTAAFLWERGRMRRLAALNGGSESHAFAINERGEVAGASETFADVEGVLVPAMRACLWRRRGGKPRELGTLGGPWSMAYALNDRGQVVGVSHTAADAETYPVLWQGGTLRRIGAEPGYAKAINARGEVAGDAPGHVFVWKTGGARRKLPGLGGENNRVGSMNDHGQIVGAATFAPRGDPVADFAAMTAFVWDGRRARRLPALGADIEARDVNNHGDIVGSAADKSGQWRAVLYRNGVLHALQDLMAPQGKDGWLLEDAFAVNDRGQIVGVGRIGPRRETRAFLLTPVLAGGASTDEPRHLPFNVSAARPAG